jgi:YHS domain-containing protein
MKNLIILSSLLVFGILFAYNSANASASHKMMHDSTHTHSDSMQLCIVTGEEFPLGGGVKYTYLNREVTFCCKGCEKAFEKEPANYLKDGLRCPVCDDDDGKQELSHVHNNVKYYFCGSGCKKKFEADAEKYLSNYKK